jgi:hypothetical protein
MARFGHIPAIQPKSSHIRPDSDQYSRNLAVLGKMPAILAENIAHRNPETATEHCQIPFFAVSDFFVQAKHQNIFSEKSFFLKNDFVENI